METDYLNMLNQYLDKKVNIKEIEQKLEEKYNTILLNQQNEIFKYFKILNTMYLENLKQDDYNYLLNKKNNNYSLEEDFLFVEKTYKKVITSKDDKIKYYKINDYDINLNNCVKNGTLVFVINYQEDYNTEIRPRKLLIKDFLNYLNELEIQFTNILNIPVRILTNCFDIPPRSL